MNNINDLKEKFLEIKNPKWIKSVNNSTSGIGLTFEKLLGKERESFEMPDYNGIEIKTHSSTSDSYITLFNATPDGDYLFEIPRLKDNYGYPDKIKRDSLVFMGNVNGRTAEFIGIKYKFKIKVGKKEEKIRLEIYDRNDNLIENEISWTFSTLREKINRKLQLLALVTADKKIQNDKHYYRYTQIDFFQLKDFETFLDLIEKGKIIVTFSIGVFRTGEKRGQIHNHGTAFRISEKNLELLYTKLLQVQ